jgi:hypothetical protein
LEGGIGLTRPSIHVPVETLIHAVIITTVVFAVFLIECRVEVLFTNHVRIGSSIGDVLIPDLRTNVVDSGLSVERRPFVVIEVVVVEQQPRNLKLILATAAPVFHPKPHSLLTVSRVCRVVTAGNFLCTVRIFWIPARSKSERIGSGRPPGWTVEKPDGSLLQLDAKLSLSPLFTLLGFFLGFGGGTVSLVYEVLGSQKKKK